MGPDFLRISKNSVQDQEILPKIDKKPSKKFPGCLSCPTTVCGDE